MPGRRTGARYAFMAFALSSAAGAYVVLSQTGCEAVLDFSGKIQDGGPPDARPTIDAGADQFEPNDNFAAATVITPMTYPGLSIFPKGDHDFYKFTVPGDPTGDAGAGGAHDVTIQALFMQRDGDLDMRLYNSSMAQIDMSAGFTDNEQISRLAANGQALPPGDYYIEIYSFNDRFTNSYTLVLNIL